MYSKHSIVVPGAMSRGSFLKLSGAGVAGVFALGIMGSGSALAQASLRGEFEAAAKEYNVPVELLLAIGYVNTRWEMPPVATGEFDPGDLHGSGGYGVMQLNADPKNNTLQKARELTDFSDNDLKTDRAANVLGGAAVLGSLIPDPNPNSLGKWYEAVADYGAGDLYAQDVYATLREGVSWSTSEGTRVEIQPHPDLDFPQTRSVQATGDYSRSTFYGAYSGNYTNASRPGSNPINKIVIHVTQGSWSSAINWFKDSRAGTSAHYTIRSSDGFIGQSVREEDIAYHAGNWSYNQTSVGIEHEGYISDSKWFTESMYRSSAKLTAYLCKKYKIPMDRQHIIGHVEVPYSTHTDPGNYWNWTKYMSYVREAAGTTTSSTKVNRDPLPNSGGRYSQIVGDLMSSRFRASSAWIKSSYHSDTNYGGTHRALKRPTRSTSDNASYKIKTPVKGIYEVYAWWPADPGYNPRTKIRIKTTSGWVRRIVNQKTTGGKWISLGRHKLAAGDSYRIKVSSVSRRSGYIIADAIGVVKR